MAQARVADLLRRGLSAAKFLHTFWRDTGSEGSRRFLTPFVRDIGRVQLFVSTKFQSFSDIIASH